MSDNVGGGRRTPDAAAELLRVAAQQATRPSRRPERIEELLDELAAYWRRSPDLRLGQIVGNFTQALAAEAGVAGGEQGSYNIEDDILLGLLRTGERHPSEAAQQYLESLAEHHK